MLPQVELHNIIPLKSKDWLCIRPFLQTWSHVSFTATTNEHKISQKLATHLTYNQYVITELN